MRPLLPAALLCVAVLLASSSPATSSHAGGDCDLGGDADGYAGAIPVPVSCDAHVSGTWGSDDRDRFVLDAAPLGRVALGVTLANGGENILMLTLEAPDGIVDDVSVWPGETATLADVTDAPGAYVLTVRGFGDAPESPYHFDAWAAEAPEPVPAQDDCGSGRDAGYWLRGAPVALPGPGTCEGALADHGRPYGYGRDDTDEYLVSLPIGGRAILEMRWGEGIELWEVCVEDVDCAIAGEGGFARIEGPIRRTGEHLVWVHGYADEGVGLANYSFTLTVIPPEARTQTQEGSLRAPAGPASYATRGLGEEVLPREGLSHAWMELVEPMRPESAFFLNATWALPVGPMMSVTFYAEEEGGLRQVTLPCGGQGHAIRCDVPHSESLPPVTHALVTLEAGAEVAYEATYASWVQA